MSPSQLAKNYRYHWKDFPRPPNDFEKLNNAYAGGDYTTSIEFLNCLLTNDTDKVSEPEHILLARAMCFQQMREHQRVISDTTEVVKVTVINGTSLSNVSATVSTPSNDHIFCRILALWLRSLAFESIENWKLAKNDLSALKTLILEKNTCNMITFKTEGVLSVFLPHVTPLIAQYKINSIIFNLHCVNDRYRRMVNLVAKDAARCKNSSQAFHLIDENIKNCNDLAKKFHYRLLLRRPLHPSIHVNMWYTLDLMFVSEMGLFKREDLIGVEGYTLGCKLLDHDIDKEKLEKYEVKVRPMSAESREWSDCTDTNWAGVQNGGKGGLEFCIIHTNKQLETLTNKCNGLSISDKEFNKSDGSNGLLKSNGIEGGQTNSNHQLYLYVYPIQAIVDENCNNKNENLDSYDINDNFKNKNTVNCSNKKSNGQENNLVPLCIGPINIVSCETYSSSCVHHIPPNAPNAPNGSSYSIFPDNNIIQSKTSCGSRRKSPWSNDDCLVDNYRAFILPNGKYMIIKELWDAGIPGKVWDSAFIIVQMIKDKILKKPNLFTGKRILDLSTGTGYVGLYLAAFLSTLKKSSKSEKNNLKTNVVLTDLDHALNLIRGNLELNKYIFNSNNKITVEVEALRWGDSPKAKKFGVLDYVFASDVVYEPELFDSLIQTLMAVCTPRRTKVYLGYKRRGLTEEEETRFFDKLRNNFQTSAVQGLGNLAEEGKVNVYLLSRK